jgi:hypothetical protein
MSGALALLAFLSNTDDLMHVLIVLLSIVVLTISVTAFWQKRNARYLMLFVAFFFLALSQIFTLGEVLFYSGALITIPFVGIHLTHLFDFLMLVTFGLALLRNWDQRKPVASGNE